MLTSEELLPRQHEQARKVTTISTLMNVDPASPATAGKLRNTEIEK